MPVKDLVGRPRPSAEQRAFEQEMVRRLAQLRRNPPGHPDNDGLLPVAPPSGPSPMPLAGAADPEEE